MGTGSHGKIGARQTPWNRLGAVNFNPFIKISPAIAFYLFTICYRISRNFPAIHNNEHPWKYERTTWLPMRFDSRLKLQKRLFFTSSSAAAYLRMQRAFVLACNRYNWIFCIQVAVVCFSYGSCIRWVYGRSVLIDPCVLTTNFDPRYLSLSHSRGQAQYDGYNQAADLFVTFPPQFRC